ncbi:uncharacterized protein J3D65DRAFT_62382 [Phyllosticta citribraziliensis]|uniref:Uncharacterized protein n=1 Tax=Phyllosticta citribraziliensis TaxID=989973 RepID=A0ABR1LGW9_9PEZI
MSNMHASREMQLEQGLILRSASREDEVAFTGRDILTCSPCLTEASRCCPVLSVLHQTADKLVAYTMTSFRPSIHFCRRHPSLRKHEQRGINHIVPNPRTLDPRSSSTPIPIGLHHSSTQPLATPSTQPTPRTNAIPHAPGTLLPVSLSSPPSNPPFQHLTRITPRIPGPKLVRPPPRTPWAGTACRRPRPWDRSRTTHLLARWS